MEISKSFINNCGVLCQSYKCMNQSGFITVDGVEEEVIGSDILTKQPEDAIMVLVPDKKHNVRLDFMAYYSKTK